MSLKPFSFKVLFTLEVVIHKLLLKKKHHYVTLTTRLGVHRKVQINLYINVQSASSTRGSLLTDEGS